LHYYYLYINPCGYNKQERKNDMTKITLKRASFIVSEYANDPIKESNDFLNSFKDQVDITVEELENYIGFKLDESDLLMVGL
jgi:hypothetical protein